MARLQIPFNKPCFTGREQEYIAKAIELGWIAGDGHFTKRCNEYLERLLGCSKALLTTSCTHALEMTALLLDIGPGDEVILPSFTFVSCANAFVIRGARPVFADIRPDTLNIDEGKLERLMSPRTKAILVVHYAGVACEMDAILEIAGRHGVPVIEDNAHGLFGTYRGRMLGTFGVFATQSFHETKNIMCGEGGALVINDPERVERAEIIREKGTNRSRFFRGQVDKYTWVDHGSSYLPSEVIAAFLYSQLEASGAIQSERKRIWDTYDRSLAEWSEATGIQRPFVPEYCDQPFHMYYLLMPSLDTRQAFIEHMRARSIGAVFHYVSLHTSEMGMRFGYHEGDLPVTESVSDRLVRLPFFNTLSEDEQFQVIRAVQEFRP